MQLAEPGVRAGAHPAQVVADFGQRNRDDAQRTGCLDETVARALCFEVVERLGDGKSGFRSKQLDNLLWEAERRIDSGADGGAAERNLGDVSHRVAHSLDAESNLTGVAAELLAEGDRGRIHEVGTAGLDGRLPEFGLDLEGLREVLERRDELLDERARHGDVNRGREHVVGRLRRIDVVVRMNGRTEVLRRERGQHLVDVHVAGGTAARLVDVDRELVVVVTGDDRIGRLDDRVDDLRVENAERAVRNRRGLLNTRERHDLGRLETETGDGEILDRALGLCPIERVDGHSYLAHGVVFDSVLRVRGHFVRFLWFIGARWPVRWSAFPQRCRVRRDQPAGCSSLRR